MREHFDRSVRYLPDEGKFVVVLRHFRGQIEVEEAGFFVRACATASGEIELSDETTERLDCASLRNSPLDGAWLCTVKRDLVPEGLPARFQPAAQAQLLEAVAERDGRPGVMLAGGFHALPAELR
jgi:hypothetical protein